MTLPRVPRRWSAPLLALLLILGACTGDEADPRPAHPSCTDDLHAAFSAWAAVGFSGAVAVATGERFDCVAGYGSADDAAGTPNAADTVFSIGSVTKAVTAATIVDLADRGKLGLDDPVGRYVPGLAGPAAAATVRQLLLHTSGLTGGIGADHEPLDRAGAVAALSALPLAFPPGSEYLYSNAGYTLLALIVEQVSGTGYRRHTVDRILTLPGGEVTGGFWNGDPAAPGPRAVGYSDTGQPGQRGDFAGPHWALDGNGGLAMTVGQLARWTHALFSGRLVSAGAVRTISTVGFDHGDGRGETPGWVAFDASMFGQSGFAAAGGGGDTGHNVVVGWIPQRQRTVVIASNRPVVTAEELIRTVGRALVADAPLPVPSAPVGGFDPAAIVGRYVLPTGGSFEVTVRDNRVVAGTAGPDAMRLLLRPRGMSDEDVTTHENLVADLLAGRTAEGRDERGTLADEHGPITAVTVVGSMVDDGELRTYVAITAGQQTLTGWYAVNRTGGIEAAEVPTEPPSLRLVPVGGNRFRPDDPAGTGPDVTVEFGDGTMIVTGPGGTTVARVAR